MIGFASALERDGSYRILWIDCEEHHTTEGFVADIIDQIRAVDPRFPPYLMRAGESLGQSWDQAETKYAEVRATRERADRQQFERAVERIREALQRGRYVLCIDSPVDIARPQTVHHNLPTFLPANGQNEPLSRDRMRKFTHRIRRFFKFLRMLLLEKVSELAPWEIGESYIALTLKPPAARHLREKNKDDTIFEVCRLEVDAIQEALENAYSGRVASVASPRWPPLPAEREPGPLAGSIDRAAILCGLLGDSRGGELKVCLDAMTARVLLSVFRRPRSYLALRSLLAQGGDVQVELPRSTIPVAEIRPKHLIDLFGIEGGEKSKDGDRLTPEGLIWFKSKVRSDAYGLLSEGPRNWFDAFWDHPQSVSGPEMTEDIVRNLILLSILHRRAARFYFSEVYASSHDLDALREYIYHRVSCLRFLARLTFVARRYQDFVRKVLDGLSPKIKDDWLGELGYSGQSRASASLSDRLLGSRLGELQAFRATLSRESATILRTLNANTWISWLERLISEECDWMREDFFLVKASALKTDPPRSRAEEAFDGELNQLENTLFNQEARFLEEKADWGSALRALTGRAFTRVRKMNLETGSGELWDVLFPADEVKGFVKYLRNAGDASLAGSKGWATNHEWRDFKDALNTWPTNLKWTEPQLVDLENRLQALHPREDNHPVTSSKLNRQRAERPATRTGWIMAPRYVTWHLSALDLADALIKASNSAHHLAIAEKIQKTKGVTESGRTAKALLDVARWMIDGLRRSQQVLPGLRRKVGTGRTAQESPFYSESILRTLRDRLDRVDLERSLRVAIDAFKQANLWFDDLRMGELAGEVSGKVSPSTFPLAAPVKRELGARKLDARDPVNAEFLDNARHLANELHELARQVVFDDRPGYNRFRALALMLRARSDYLAGTDVEDALSLLDRATALLDATVGTAPAIDRIAALRSRSECLMLDADFKLSLGGRSGYLSDETSWEQWKANWSAAERRLVQARVSLGEASRIFRKQRGRNVAWWLRLSRDYTQWCIEASVLSICGDPIWKSRRAIDRTRVTRVDEVFDLGVAATRAGLNALSWSSIADPLDPLDNIEKQANDAEVLRSMGQWLCLLGCMWYRVQLDGLGWTTASGRDVEFRKSNPDDDYVHGAFEDFWRRWKELNERHRLPKLVSDGVRDAVRNCFHPMTEVVTVLRGVAAQKNSITFESPNAWRETEPQFAPAAWTILRESVIHGMGQLTRHAGVQAALKASLEISD